jgi:uncharacterized membrane protein HdeD (DUF308 family)
MSAPRGARPMFGLFWSLYLVLGGISIGAGLLFLTAPGFVFPATGPERVMVRVVGVIFIVFGVVRVINSLLQLKRLRGR